MGELMIECIACNGSFESEQEYNEHNCEVGENCDDLEIKQEIFVDVDEESNSQSQPKSKASSTPKTNSLISTIAGNLIKVQNKTAKKIKVKSPQKIQQNPSEDVDPLSLNVEESDFMSEEKPPGIDHETIRSLVLTVDQNERMENMKSSELVNYGRQYNCRLCHESFNGSNEFAKHFGSKHKNYRPYECSICGKKFLQKHYVSLHMRVHTGERPYKCKLCPRSYSHKTSYVIHMRIHNGIKPFRCNVCGKRCYDKSGLNSHMRSHTKETPYSCTVCDRKFTHSKSLLVHFRNHTGEKPYTCSYCGKSFRHWHKHKIHVRLHTGERPYKCNVCGKGFPRNDEVNRHMKSHSGIKSFKCSICGVYCATQASITGHINLHHSNLKEGEQPEKTVVTDSNSGILGKEHLVFPSVKDLKSLNEIAKDVPVPEGETSSGTSNAKGVTRVIEITSKEDRPLPSKRKSGRILCEMPNSNRDEEGDTPMNYKEFMEWQERMLTKQGLVVKKYPCDDDKTIDDKIDTKTSDKNVNPLTVKKQPTSGELLRKALTGSNDSSTVLPKSTNEKQTKPQYILISQPGNPSSKILLPISSVPGNAGRPAQRPNSQPQTLLTPPQIQSAGAAMPMVQTGDQNKSLFLMPPNMPSQSLLLVQNGSQKMLLLAPTQPGTAQNLSTQQQSISLPGSSSASEQTKIPIPTVKIKMEPDPLDTESLDVHSDISGQTIKEEPPEDPLEPNIKQEPEDD